MRFFDYGHYPYGYMMSGDWNWFFFGYHLIGLGLLLLAGWFVYKLLKKRKVSHENDAALDTLKNLYASGKIDEEEYLRKKEVLSRK